MAKKNQSDRLTKQHKSSKGVVGIFGKEAKSHDFKVNEVSNAVLKHIQEDFPSLKFRHRDSIKKEEINDALRKIDSELGQTLFVPHSSIIPDGGIIEVMDDLGDWRIVLVSEAKHQGKDIDNIRKGKFVGKNNN